MNGERAGFKVGEIGGTPIYVQVSFLILAAFFVILYMEGEGSLASSILWLPVLFFSVVFHELAHAGVIGAFGFGTSVIYLGGFGGVTINERNSKPWQDAMISVAGPLSSFAMAALSFAALLYIPAAREHPLARDFLSKMSWANVIWGVFNFLPIFPMDGGKALQNVIHHFTDSKKAFIATTWISLVLGVLLVATSLLAKQFFVAIITVSLVMQNYTRWSAYRSHRDNPPNPPE